MPDRPSLLRADTKINFRKVVVFMKSKKANSGDVPVPGRSWKQNKITCKADVMLSGDAAGCTPPGMKPCLKAVMTPPEGDCHGRKQGSKRAA